MGFFKKILGGADVQQPPRKTEASDKPLPPGYELCDGYIVRVKLGQGGMGEVYLVENISTGDLRAAKIMRGREDVNIADLAGFRQEALSLLNVGTHPFLVKLHDLREKGKDTIILMEYVAPTAGCTSISDYIIHTQDYTNRLLGIWSVQFCVGMEHAIGCGIAAHRDIKPDNLLVDSGAFLKIGDFGLALAASQHPAMLGESSGRFNRLQLLQSVDGNLVCGTPGYIAPELMTGGSASPFSDMFSFGVTLWQLAARSMEMPYDVTYKGDIRAYQNAVLSKALSHEVRRIDSPFFEIINCCLSPDPEKRYSDFTDLREAIKRAAKRAELGAVDFIVAPGFKGSFEDYLNRGRAYLVLGRFNRAFRILNEAVGIKPDSSKVLCARAEALYGLGDLLGARRDYQAAHRLEPEADAPLTGMALILLELDSILEAMAELEKVLARHPNNLEAKLLKARGSSTQGDQGAALLIVEQVLASAPEHAIAHEYRGHILKAMGDLQGAAQSFKQSLQKDPFRLSNHLVLSSLWTSVGNDAAADAQYGFAQQLFKGNSEALNKIAAHMSENGHAKKAIELFSDLAEIEPSSRSTLLVNIGNAYLNLNDDASALKSFQDAIKADSTNALAYRRLGDFEDENGSIDKAADYYARASTLEPDNPSHLACAGTAYLRLQKYEIATSFYRKSLEILPNQPKIQYNLAASLVYQGLTEKAIDELAMALRFDPHYGRAWYLKANIELKLCRISDATNSVKHALNCSSSLNSDEIHHLRSLVQEHKLIV